MNDVSVSLKNKFGDLEFPIHAPPAPRSKGPSAKARLVSFAGHRGTVCWCAADFLLALDTPERLDQVIQALQKSRAVTGREGRRSTAHLTHGPQMRHQFTAGKGVPDGFG